MQQHPDGTASDWFSYLLAKFLRHSVYSQNLQKKREYCNAIAWLLLVNDVVWNLVTAFMCELSRFIIRR